MKRKAVIEAVLCQRYKIRNGIRRNILIKLQFDVAVVPNPDDRRRMRLVLIRIFRAAAADGACRKSGKESRCNFKADFKDFYSSVNLPLSVIKVDQAAREDDPALVFRQIGKVKHDFFFRTAASV